MKHVVIVGNGIAGVTAARTIRKLQPEWPITIVSAESPYFFSRTALMYVYMGHMCFEDTQPYENTFWEKNRLTLRQLYVNSVDTDNKRLQTSDGQSIDYDILLLATGSRYNKFDWPGEDLPGVQGLVTKQDLELLETNSEGVDHAVVVGGGLIGVELAEMLHSRGIKVTFLVREDRYMSRILPAEESEMVVREIRRHGIDLRLSTELDRIEPGRDGRVAGVVTTQGEAIPCRLVGLTTGVRPNIDVVRSSDVATDRGILVNRHFETNVPDVYAAGDCVEFEEPLPGRRKIEQLWYTGRMHGETVGKTITGHRTEYDPGVFFNSAKFFGIEYQTYGEIASELPDEQDSFYWESNNGRRSIRINSRSADRAVVGFNVMGIRLRQDICSRWINNGTPVEEVIGSLEHARFDPEFARRNERAARRWWRHSKGEAQPVTSTTTI